MALGSKCLCPLTDCLKNPKADNTKIHQHNVGNPRAGKLILEGCSMAGTVKLTIPPRTALYLLVFGLGMAVGVAVDASLSVRTPFPDFWISLLSGGFYISIVLVAVGFPLGGGAAVLAGLAHVIPRICIHANCLSEKSKVVPFALMGLLAGVFTRSPRNPDSTGPSLPKFVDKGDCGQPRPPMNPIRDGRVPPEFARALRMPLFAIESAGYALEDSTITDEERRELASMIVRECYHLDVLIRPLDFLHSRGPSYREIGLSAVLDVIFQLAESVTKPASITLRKAECPEDLGLIWDPESIEIAILNLLPSIARRVEAGDEITLSARIERQYAVIELSHKRIGRLLQMQITTSNSQGEMNSHRSIGA